MSELATSLIQSTLPEWTQILTLIFGGCCSNVWALESLLKHHPGSGTFLTFSQFIFVTAQNLPKFLEFRRPPSGGKEGQQGLGIGWPRWKKREVPLKRWMGQVVLFLGISLLNNYAFGLKIPMTLHIIFRSGGLCVSMLTSYLVVGKRYRPGQIIAGLMITAGIVIATISAPSRRTSPADTVKFTATGHNLGNMEFAAGIAVLSLALVLSSFLGLFQEETYRRYGKAWQEGLFYSHLLSIPFFIPFYPSLTSTFRSYAMSPPSNILSLTLPTPQTMLLSMTSPKASVPSWQRYALPIPSAFLALAINVLTQGMCIRGVNRLTARVSSTTVNLVLTVRKAVSLAISVLYYGSGVTPGLAIGGAMVLIGTILYSFASTTPPAVEKRDSSISNKGSSEVSPGRSDRGDLSARTTGIELPAGDELRKRKK